MINRLNSISMPSLPNQLSNMPGMNGNGGYQSFGNGYSNFAQSLPAPQSMAMPEIRTEADLALFNQFMISLGRDAANHGSAPIPMAQVPSYGGSSGSSSSPLSDQSPIEDLFNPDELASLGLAGMPGMPIPGIGAPSQDLATSLPNQSVSFAGLYPQLDNLHLSRSRGHSMSDVEPSKRTIAGLPRNHSIANSNLSAKPSFASNVYGLGSNPYPDLGNLDSLSTDFYSGLGSNDQMYNFDSLARSKVPPPPATLAPRDFYKKTYRHVAPLGAAPSSRLAESSERSSVADSPESIEEELEDMPESRISVRNLLISDDMVDPSLRLPALHRISSREDTPGQLPGVDSISRPRSPPHATPVKRHTEDDILRGVKRLELDDRSSPAIDDRRPGSARAREAIPREVRRHHAMMIRAWLVSVNLEWRRRRLEALGADFDRLQQERDDDDVTVKQEDLENDEEDEDEDELEDAQENEMRYQNVGRRLNLADIAA